MNYDEITSRLVSEFTRTIEMFGLSALESRLFAYLYIKNEPQTLDEMSEALGKSKTAMSTSIRSLASLNLVSPYWKKGVRKDMYVANIKLYKMFITFYMRKWIDMTGLQKEALENLQSEMQQTLPIEEDSEKREKLETFFDEIITFHQDLEESFGELQKKAK